MIYRTQIAVLRSVPWKRHDVDEYKVAAWQAKFLDAVAYTFGINAQNLAEAVNLAVAAARDAVDRNGQYVGGVVVENHSRCVAVEEFERYKKYFHRPIEEPGIFYVSGITTYSVPKMQVQGALAELHSAAEKISQFGLPTPSFTHPKLPEEPPTRVRLLCSACGRWAEVENLGIVFSLMGDMDMILKAYPDARQSTGHANSFMRRHLLSCLHVDEGPMRGTILGIQQSDPRWSRLESSKEDADAE